MRVDRIVDLDPFSLPLTMLLPGADLAELGTEGEALAGVHLDPVRGLLHLAVQSHLVRLAGRTILIDACIGEDKPRPRRLDWHERRRTGFLKRLADVGVSPEDVDVVLCTHLHADHVGWNTRLENGRWVPTFPNARYVMARAELAHWREAAARPSEHPLNHGSYADSVLPIIEAGLAHEAEPGDEIAEGATILALFGHTPGHVGLEVANRAGPALAFCGDAIHSPVQILRPGWSSAFCSDPAAAATSRTALLERAADSDLVIVPAHLRGEGLRIERRGARFSPRFCAC